MQKRPELQHLLSKVRDVLNGDHEVWSVQSTSERLAVALVLNRIDWLQAMDYSIASAIDRIGLSWTSLIPEVAKIIAKERSEKGFNTGSYEFPARFDAQPEGGYTVTIRDFPELVTEGHSFDEALANAKAMLTMVIETRQAERVALPKPSPVMDCEHLVCCKVPRPKFVVNRGDDLI